MSKPSTITVIICTYNGSSRLDMVLEALSVQTLSERWELLVVDNASTDRTAEVAQGWVDRLPAALRVLFEPSPGKAYAMQTGMAAARGECFCIVDDDNLLEPGYLAAGVSFLESHPDVALIGGRTFPRFPEGVVPPEDFEKRFADFLACRDLGDRVLWDTVPPGAGQMGRTHVMRGIYEHIGTRLEDRVGEGVGCCEDLEKGHIARRLGWRTAHVPEMRLQHMMTERRLTGEYIDALSCAAIGTIPWLRLVADKEPNSPRWQRSRVRADSLRSEKYRLLSLLPSVLHPKLKRAGFWRRFYRARAEGYGALLRDRERINRMLRAIEEAPDNMRPPTDRGGLEDVCGATGHNVK